ncbi:MAG TPA: GNAT family N-acetyltransferase [Pyrinomonadaceae bacterium]|jgi:flavin-dependent dehydrogenase/GNAT superfamily N-acetyltransferase|nr:GNAT family N-acetyltransferase [Pyrinomonadaceae bacterium]
MNDCRLQNGSTVAIIGGGPGGAACAIKLLQGADARGLRLRVLIFEGKDFNVHANQCVGVLSPPIEDVLARELDLHLPRDLIKRQIFGYRLHGMRENVLLTGHGAHGGQLEHGRATYAVERAHFDRFLLDQARELGAEVIRSRVTGIEFVRTGGLDEVRIYSESLYEKADVVIGAFGLDEAMLSVFEEVTARGRRGFERPTRWLKSYLTTIDTSARFQAEKLGHIVHAFLLPPRCPRIEFGAVTPKGDHILVNIAGESVSSCDLDLFLLLPEVQELLPGFDAGAINYYEGRFPSSPARRPYGHRYALVGDATGWLRPFKGKGINTALLTGIRAAETMLDYGVSERALGNYRRACADLLGDFRYGVVVRRLMLMGGRLFLDPMIDVGKVDPLMYDALFDSVSGHDTYRNIIARSLRARLVRKVAARMIRGIGRHRARRAKHMQDLTVRRMTVRDIDEVLRLDEKITGKPHAAYYESKAAAYISRAPEYCLVAEHRDRVVGFVLGDVRGWEFATELSGWLEIIGVDPDYHGQGVSRALMDELFAKFHRAGVGVVNTMVNWNDGDLIDYFRANGFDRGEYVNLVKRLGDEEGEAE